MKRFCLICLLPLLLAACGSKDTTAVSLTGEITGLGNDTIYLYGADHFYPFMDTLLVHDDKFSATLQPDTLVATWLHFSDGTEYPLFMDKGHSIHIKGDTVRLDSLHISGHPANEELYAFLRSTESETTDSLQTVQDKAEAFIGQHPSSPASLYLLEKYFIRVPEPDYARIEEVAGRISGGLKDRPFVRSILEQMDDIEKTAPNKMAPAFHLPDKDGEMLSRGSFKGQYLFIHFWASWDKTGRKIHPTLRHIYLREKKNKDFAMLGISVDIHKEDWLQAIRQDTLEWKQASDLRGWESDVVQRYNVQALPCNILLNPSGRIEAQNLDEAALSEKIEKIKEQSKAEKARNSKRRR